MALMKQVKGPKGTVKVRNFYTKERKLVSYDELLQLQVEDLPAVLVYLQERGDIVVKYGLRNYFPNSPIYDNLNDIPISEDLNGYFVNDDCIIELFEYIGK